MLRKELKFLTLGMFVLAIAVAYAAVNFSTTSSVFPTQTLVNTESMSNGGGLIYQAMVCPTVTRASGVVETLGCSHNMFTNGGRNATRDRLTLDSPSLGAFEDIGIGNFTANGGANCTGAPADLNMNDTALCGEYINPANPCGLDRLNVANTFNRKEPGNGTSGGYAGNWTIGGEFTFSGAGCTGTALVNATGLYNATSKASTIVLFAQNTFTTATLSVNDKINITWFIWIT